MLSSVSEGLFPMPDGEEAQHEYFMWKYFLLDSEKEKVLDQCGEFVLDAWIRERPGTRPRWWWEKQPETPRRLGANLYESEAACLKRLGLLTPEEERQLQQADFEPDSDET